MKIKVSKLFKQNLKANTTTIVNVGGARSGKSYAMAQLLIYKALKNPSQIAITRKTMPALKMTAMRLVLDLLKTYNLFLPQNLNKTENFYNLGFSRFQFFSLDDPEKIKSAEFNYIWLEEATEFTYQDYCVLLTRLSAPLLSSERCNKNKINDIRKNQIFLTLNPTDINSWIYKKVIPSDDVTTIKSTYKDNKFLQQSYIKTLLSLKNLDANSYKVFALGEWGSSENIIYKNWSFVDNFPPQATEFFYGLDFGFNNPTSLVKVAFYDDCFYAEEQIYQSGLTNNALIEKLKFILKDRQKVIYADSAEPNRIAEIYNEGFNIKPAIKNVLCGILSLKARKIFITKNSLNLIKEYQTYSWKTDKEGNILEEPIKVNDHALDALRYAIYTFTRDISLSNNADLSFI